MDSPKPQITPLTTKIYWQFFLLMIPNVIKKIDPPVIVSNRGTFQVEGMEYI